MQWLVIWLGSHIVNLIPPGHIFFCMSSLLLQTDFKLVEYLFSFEQISLSLTERLLSFSKLIIKILMLLYQILLPCKVVLHEVSELCILFILPSPDFLSAGFHGQVPGIVEQRTIWVGALVQLTTENFWISPTIIIDVFGGTESCQSKALLPFSISHNLIRWPTDSALTSGNAVDGKQGSSSVLISVNALKGGNSDIVDISRWFLAVKVKYTSKMC